MCLTILTLGGELTFSGRMRSGDRVGEKVGGTVGRRRGAWRGRWSTSGYLVTATRSNAPTSTKSYTQCRSQINMCQSPNRAFWTQLLNRSKHSGLSADLLRSALLITFPVNLHTPTVQYPCSAVSNINQCISSCILRSPSTVPNGQGSCKIVVWLGDLLLFSRRGGGTYQSFKSFSCVRCYIFVFHVEF